MTPKLKPCLREEGNEASEDQGSWVSRLACAKGKGLNESNGLSAGNSWLAEAVQALRHEPDSLPRASGGSAGEGVEELEAKRLFAEMSAMRKPTGWAESTIHAFDVILEELLVGRFALAISKAILLEYEEVLTVYVGAARHCPLAGQRPAG